LGEGAFAGYAMERAVFVVDAGDLGVDSTLLCLGAATEV